jgi:hypothetical protein
VEDRAGRRARRRAETGLEIYTTRPDTLFGASFMGVAPDHPLARAIAAPIPDAAAFVGRLPQGGDREAEIEQAEKIGFDTGLRARHPFDPNGPCRSGRPISSCRPMDPGPSSVARPTISATWISRANTICRWSRS